MRRVLPILVLLALPLLAYWWGRQGGAQPSPTVATRSVTATTAVKSTASPDAPAGGRSTPPATRAAASLPASNLPLAQSVEALERAARDGDRAALLRLSRELGRCFDYAFRTRELSALEANIAVLERRAGAEDEHTPRLVLQRDDAGKLRTVQVEDTSPLRLQRRALDRLRDRSEREFGSAPQDCAGLDGKYLEQAFEWQLRAARSGDPAAMLAFVSEPWFNGNRAAAELNKLETYISDGPGMLASLIARNDPGALWLGAQAYADNERETEPSQLVKPDPVRAYSLVLRYLAAGDAEHRDEAEQLAARLREELTPAQIAQAQAASGGG